MTKRVVNFNAGPATLPLAALERAQTELLDYDGTGMSILEHSHRGKDYEALHNHTIGLLRELLAVPDDYEVMFMQGGATAQFAYLPMNLLADGQTADYVLTGSWSKKALSEGKFFGQLNVAADTEQDGKFERIPAQSELKLDPNARYVHVTSNNTIMGTQYFTFPETGDVPLVADMSSDILWRPIDVSKFGLIYAGAQKNIGPAGITLVIARKSLIEGGNTNIPKVFRYGEVAKANSLLNTIPTFGVYLIRNVLELIRDKGGLAAMEKHNQDKAKVLYDAIDSSDFYRCPINKDDRSVMNPVFRLPSEDLEKKMVADAKEAGFVGIKGHRSVGGIRVSIYNAQTIEGVSAFADFMQKFATANG